MLSTRWTIRTHWLATHTDLLQDWTQVGVVAHTCNSRYSGDTDRSQFRASPAKSQQDPHLKGQAKCCSEHMSVTPAMPKLESKVSSRQKRETLSENKLKPKELGVTQVIRA
jgi:hypothetical protein